MDQKAVSRILYMCEGKSSQDTELDRIEKVATARHPGKRQSYYCCLNCWNKLSISDLQLFDDVFDLHKCDPEYFRWDVAVRKQFDSLQKKEKQQAQN